jgi:hypothetical protein
LAGRESMPSSLTAPEQRIESMTSSLTAPEQRIASLTAAAAELRLRQSQAPTSIVQSQAPTNPLSLPSPPNPPPPTHTHPVSPPFPPASRGLAGETRLEEVRTVRVSDQQPAAESDNECVVCLSQVNPLDHTDRNGCSPCANLSKTNDICQHLLSPDFMSPTGGLLNDLSMWSSMSV